MSLTDIEAELEGLAADELRRLALKSWEAYLRKEGHLPNRYECNEDDPHLLAALDDAIAKADATASERHSADVVRARLSEWTSR